MTVITGKGIVNLIDSLQAKGMSSDDIIDTIRYIELADPQTKAMIDKEKTADKQN